MIIMLGITTIPIKGLQCMQVKSCLGLLFSHSSVMLPGVRAHVDYERAELTKLRARFCTYYLVDKNGKEKACLRV